ncbi:MAG: hypothetical protein ACKOBH_00300 [bacterium]
MKQRLIEAWRRGQRGWPADNPVAQFPNAPLLVAIAAWIVRQLTTGSTNDWASAVFYVALACFAFWELVDGVNRFRRVGGAVILLLTVYLAAKALGA